MLLERHVAQRNRVRARCTSCHNVDQRKFVPPMLVELATMWPQYVPLPVGKRGNSKLDTVLNAPGGYDDKMVVVDASMRGEKRGVALPLLLDLARKEDAKLCADVVELLRALDTSH